MNCLMFTLVLMFIMIHLCLQDPSVCKENITYTSLGNVIIPESYLGMKTEWCKKWPFRCKTVVTLYRNITKLQTILNTHVVEKCCTGYEMDETLRQCVPQCSEPCINGKCIKPDKCECEEGYVGSSCDICLKCGSKCPLGTFGEQCEETCKCQNKSPCNHITGQCICSDGWIGEDCSTPCPEGYFGKNCKKECPDDKDIPCDHVTGGNKCRDGYMGKYCQEPCSQGYFGENCSHKCDCKNNSTCDNVNGMCHCIPGWSDKDCGTPCPEKKYGVNCNKDCLCSNQSRCSPIDGQCHCFSGWTGIYCTEKCKYGYYGSHCSQPCICEGINSICDHVEGCKCPENFTGVNCDVNINDKYEPPTEAEYIQEENYNTVIIIIVILVISLIFIIVINGYIYYKRIYLKKKNRQDTLQVRYTANSFSTENLQSKQTLNNYPQIQNDLGIPKKFNGVTIERNEPNTSRNSETEYSEPFLKNVVADKNNPNLNKSVENLSYMPMNRISEEPETRYENIDNNTNRNNSYKPDGCL